MEVESTICCVCLKKRKRSIKEESEGCSTTGSNQIAFMSYPEEHISSPKPGPSKKRRATNFVWKQNMTESLFQFLIQVIENGERANKYGLVTKHISEVYNVAVTTANVSNHLRTWRTKWQRISHLRNLSGTSWNEDEKIIIMGEHKARTYIEANPHCDGLLNKPLRYYDELAIICGSDLATGSFATVDVAPDTDEVVHSIDMDPSPPTEPRRVGSYNRATSDGMSISMNSKGKSIACSSRSSKQGEKGEVANLIATTLAQLAGVMQSKHDKNANLAVKVYRALNELVGETYDVTTFELEHVIWANNYLLERTKIAWGFLKKPVEEMKAWLQRLLLSDVYDRS